MPTATQGHQIRGFYRHEDNGFAQSPNDSTDKALGANATLDTAQGTNNAVRVFEPGSRQAIDIIEQNFDGSFSVSFDYTNPWWLNFLYGAPSKTDNNDGSYTYTWNGEKPQSQRIFIGREPDGSMRVLTGCVAASVSVSSNVGDSATITINGAYADDTTTNSIRSQPTIDEKPMTFADASLSLGGDTLGYVQAGSVEVTNDFAMVREWGTRVAIDYAPYTLNPAVNFQKINEDGETENLEKMYGSVGSSSVQSNVTNREAMTLTLDNGQSAGSGINKVAFDLTGSFPADYGESGLGDPQADVTEDINRMAESVTVRATNEVSTAK